MVRLDAFRYRLFILACIAAAMACHGCGGGGGGAAVSGAAFAPNYVYHLRGLSHWPHFPVRVYFDRGSEAYTPERAALAVSGFGQWAAATDGQARFTIVDDPKQAQITVHLVPKLEGSLIGWTTWRYDDSHSITSADIQMGVDGLDDRDIAWDGAHEIGHAMGIDGHSDQGIDVMFPSHVLGTDWALTMRDVNTVKTDYSWLFMSGAAPAANSGRASGTLHTAEVRCYRN